MKYNRNRNKTTRWNLFFHYSTLVYNILIGIVLVPLYLRFIPQELYGYWLASGNILAWISVIDPGFGMVVQQKVAYYYGADNKEKIGEYIGSGFLWMVIFLILLSVVGTAVYVNFTGWLEIEQATVVQQLENAFLLAFIGALLTFISYTLVAVNQGLQSSLGIGFIYMFANLSGIGLTVYLLYTNYGVVALGAAFLWRGGCMVIGNGIYLLARMKGERISWRYQSDTMREMRSLLSFNFLGRIGGIGNGQLAAFLITKFLSPIDTVVYRFTLTIPDSSKLLLARPALALLPAITHLLGEGNHEKARAIFLQLLQYLIWVSGLVLVGFVCLNQYFIGLWTGSEFYGGDTMNGILVLWVVLSIFTSTLSHMVFALGNIKMNNVVVFVQAILYVALLLVGLKFYGLLGACIALLLAEIVVPVWYFPYTFVKKVGLPREDAKKLIEQFIPIILISGAIMTIWYLSPPEQVNNWLVFIGYGVLIFGSYLGSLFAIVPNFRREVKKIVLRTH